MPSSLRSALAGLLLAAAVAMPALADGLKDEIAPTGKLRVAIAISLAGGAFWSTKTEAGYAGVPVDLGKEMAARARRWRRICRAPEFRADHRRGWQRHS